MHHVYVGHISDAVRENIGSISGGYRQDIGILSGAYREYANSISGLYREYIGSILRLSRLYIRSISGTYWAHIGCALHGEYIGRISEAYWMHATMAGKMRGARRSAPRIKNRTHRVLDQTPAVNSVPPVKTHTPRHYQTMLFSTC